MASTRSGPCRSGATMHLSYPMKSGISDPVGSKEPTGAPDADVKVTPEMLAGASKALDRFYAGDGVYNVSDECLEEVLRAALRHAPRSYPRNSQTS